MIRKASQEKYSYVVIQKRTKKSEKNIGSTSRYGFIDLYPSMYYSNLFDFEYFKCDSEKNEWITKEDETSDNAIWNPSPISVIARLLEQDRSRVSAVVDELIEEIDWEDYKPTLHRSEWGRVLRSPLKRKGHISVDVCTPYGTVTRSTLSRASLNHIPSLYSAVKKATWGGLHPMLSEAQPRSAVTGKSGGGLKKQLFMMSDRRQSKGSKTIPSSTSKSLGLKVNNRHHEWLHEDEYDEYDEYDDYEERGTRRGKRLSHPKAAKGDDKLEREGRKKTTKANFDNLIRYAAHLKRKEVNKQNMDMKVTSDDSIKRPTSGRARLKIAKSLEAHRRRRNLTKKLEQEVEMGAQDPN